MHPTCVVNAGVFILRVCDWAKEFMKDVWKCSKFNQVFFYDQSAIIKALRMRHEGLETVKPFHSYLSKGRDREIKLFPHVAVMTHLDFNTNKGWKTMSKETSETIKSKDNIARFIFHAAGRW